MLGEWLLLEYCMTSSDDAHLGGCWESQGEWHLWIFQMMHTSPKNKQRLLGKKLSIARSDLKQGKKEHARGSESRESAETSNGSRAHQALQSTHTRGRDKVQLRGRNTFAKIANKPKTEEQGDEKPKSNDELRHMFLKG